MQKKVIPAIALVAALTAHIADGAAVASTKATSSAPSTSTIASSKLPPDELIRTVSDDVINEIKQLKGRDQVTPEKISGLVNTYIMPVVDFDGMTASTVGPAWRQATDQEKQILEKQFKQLLIRTYSGALQRVSDQTIVIRPLNEKDLGKEIVVSSVISSSTGNSQPVNMKFRLIKNDAGEWRIVDLNVMDVWLMQTYRSQFKEVINSKGLSGLISSLEKLNAANK